MDLITAVRQYIDELIRVAGPGMKVLLMDKETTSIVSCAFAQSEVMEKEVFLFERIDSGVVRDPLKHLKCVVFIRPTQDNVQLLAAELTMPLYGQYYISFSNVISKTDVKVLAEADDQETVKEVHEMYADFVAVSPHLFSLNLPICYRSFHVHPLAIRRSVQGVGAVLLAFKRHPMIRYQNSSEAAKRVAEGVQQLMTKESGLFNFRRSHPSPLLLVLDRRDDPVTPLLNQWTYQAMVHELLGICNNRVALDVGDLKEVVLSAIQDDFYSKNLYSNFGEIGQNIKILMDDFQKTSKTRQKVESIADMKTFIEQYPQFRKISGTASKHVTVVSELSRLVGVYNLLELSETEQQLACQDEHAQSLLQIERLLQHEQTSDLDVTRLVMLYALRFETHANNGLNGLIRLLGKRGVPDKYCQAVQNLLKFCGTRVRSSDLFGNSSAMAMTKKFILGLKGVENIYTQHQPYLVQLVDSLAKSRLRDQTYPYVAGCQPLSKVQEVVVFTIGGVTYEESLAVHQWNESNPSCQVILGGTTIHNGRSFIEEVVAATQATAIPRQTSGKPPVM